MMMIEPLLYLASINHNAYTATVLIYNQHNLTTTIGILVIKINKNN